jgi:hypothetical protein
MYGKLIMAICRPVEFTKKLLNTPNEAAEIKRVCLGEMEYLRKSYKTASSLRNGCTVYRNHFREVMKKENSRTIEVVLEKASKHFRLTSKQRMNVRKAYENKITGRQHNLRHISDVDGYIFKSEELLSATSYIDRLLGLCALTGRRSAEILTSAKFTVAGEDLFFEGQLKTKGRGDIGGYQIPVLTDPEVVVEGVARMRKERPDLVGNPPLAHTRTSKILSVKVKTHYQEYLGEKVIVRDLRRAYGTLAYVLNDKRFEVAKQRYISDILGHGATDRVTGGSYVDFEVTDPSYI